jgi:hypothetical protein
MDETTEAIIRTLDHEANALERSARVLRSTISLLRHPHTRARRTRANVEGDAEHN